MNTADKIREIENPYSDAFYRRGFWSGLNAAASLVEREVPTHPGWYKLLIANGIPTLNDECVAIFPDVEDAADYGRENYPYRWHVVQCGHQRNHHANGATQMNTDQFRDDMEELIAEAGNYRPCMSLDVSEDGKAVELCLDTSVNTYSDWIKGEGGDIGLLRCQETNKVMAGCSAPPKIVFDLLADRTEAATRIAALERDRVLLVNFAKDMAKNYDHCESSHRHNNGTCRVCNAEEVLQQVNEAANRDYLKMPT